MEKERYVHVRCVVRGGPASDYLVVIEFGEGYAGFVSREFVDPTDTEGVGMIEGRVLEWDEKGDGPVKIQFPASFFTASRGILSLPRDWAAKNIVPAQLKKETA